MIDVFLQKEAAHKAAAERAAASGDWTALADEARHLVAVYGAILQSGLVDRSSFGRWEALRKKWQEIGEKARDRSLAEGERKPAAQTERTTESKAVRPQAEERDDGAQPAKPSSAQPQTGLRLSDVIGLDEAKREVQDALVDPVIMPEVYKTLRIRPGRGLLLYGPPGTGKTMFARAVAGELGLPFIYRKASELKNQYVGESEKSVVRMFDEAYAQGKCLIFLDECEAVLRKRGNQKINTVESFLAEMEGFSTRKDAQIFVILATNRPWLIDSAVIRRLSAAVYVGLPEPEARRALVDRALSGIPLAGGLTVDTIVARTEGFSGSELVGDGKLCDQMKMSAKDRWKATYGDIASGDPRHKDALSHLSVNTEDFEKAMKRTVPVSVLDPEIVKRNREFALPGQTPDGDSDSTEE